LPRVQIPVGAYPFLHYVPFCVDYVSSIAFFSIPAYQASLSFHYRFLYVSNE